MASDNTRTIQSVETAFEIITYLRQQNGGTVSDLAKKTNKSSGTIHTYLSTLKAHGFVIQPGQQYELGPRFLPFGEYVRHQSKLYKAARNEIDELAQVTGEAAHLVIEHDRKIYTLYEKFGPNAVGVYYHNKKRERLLDHLHCTAAGKSILAYSSEEQLYHLIKDIGFSKNGPNSITDLNTLISELETVKERGVAFADEEQIQGIRAVGAPVCSQSNKVLGAITVSGPPTRLSGSRFHEQIPEKVLQAAEVTELNLQVEKDQLGLQT
jgi:IclR family transcriptional regulator, arginine deiminase pathway regulator